MNIFTQTNTLVQPSFEGRIPNRLVNVHNLYTKLGPEVEKIAYRNGVPMPMVLELIERSGISSITKLSKVLPMQLQAIFNTVKLHINNPEYLKSLFRVSDKLFNSLIKGYERVLFEQKIISAYMQNHISYEKIGKQFGVKSSKTWKIFDYWDVPNLHERNVAIVTKGISQGLSNTEIAKNANIRDFSVMRIRRDFNYPKYIEQKISSRNSKILERVINGERRADLAKEFGLTKRTVDRIVREKDGYAKQRAKRDVAIIERIKNNDLYKDIAKDFGISPDTVKRIAKKYNCRKK